MSGSILLAIGAAFASAYSTSQKLASTYLSPIYSMLISNAVVFVLGAIILFSQKVGKQELLFDKRGIIFGIMVGIFATGIEIFAVWAYSKQLSLVSASIISSFVGTVMMLVSAIFIFHETISPIKIIALLMAISSGIILSLAK